MLRCSACEFENRSGVRYCEECGAKLDQICPACATTVPPDRKFCGACGQALGDKSPQAPKVAPPEDERPTRAKVTFLEDERPARSAKVTFPEDEKPTRGAKITFPEDERVTRSAKVSFPDDGRPARVGEDCRLFVGRTVPDEHSLKMLVWNHLRKFGDAGTTPRKFAQGLLDKGWARGSAEACTEQVRDLFDSMVKLRGYERTEKLPGGRYRAIDLRESSTHRKR